MIKVGDCIPNVTTMHKEGYKNVWRSTHELWSGKRVLLLGIPGAFLVEYAASQLRTYEMMYREFVDNGLTDIWYTTTDDCFTQKAWNKAQQLKSVKNMPDPAAAWSDAIGMTEDMTEQGLGSKRSHRYAMVIDNLIVKTVKYEDFSHNPMTCFQVTDADTTMHYLETIKTNYERWDDEEFGRNKTNSVLL